MNNEVMSSSMSSKQRTFRDNYRNQVQGWYSGLHVSIIYVTVFGFVLLFFKFENIVFTEYLVIPVTFLFCNFFEWFLHKEIMAAKELSSARAIIYHPLQHHQLFTDKNDLLHLMIIDTFFPPYAH